MGIREKLALKADQLNKKSDLANQALETAINDANVQEARRQARIGHNAQSQGLFIDGLRDIVHSPQEICLEDPFIEPTKQGLKGLGKIIATVPYKFILGPIAVSNAGYYAKQHSAR